MARMYSRKKGKSGSTWPVKKNLPSWVRYKDEEVEMLVAKLAKEGKKPSQIGLILRDVYGIPSAKLAANKKITQILLEKKLLDDIPEDLLQLITRAVRLRTHMEENRMDMPAKRGLQLTESKIRRIVKYYKRTGKIAQDWKYDPKSIRLYVE